MSETIIKNKLVLKDIGNPKGLLGQPETVKKFLLGTIFGIATKVGKKGRQNDPTQIDTWLVGDFEGIPAEADKDTVRSGKLFLPEGIHNMIAAQIEGENAASSVQFALEVYTQRSTNAAGYEWVVQPLVKTDVADPLAAMRQQIADKKSGAAQIADGTKSKDKETAKK